MNMPESAPTATWNSHGRYAKGPWRLLNENEEDRRIAHRILCDQLGLTEKEIAELERNKATA